METASSRNSPLLGPTTRWRVLRRRWATLVEALRRRVLAWRAVRRASGSRLPIDGKFAQLEAREQRARALLAEHWGIGSWRSYRPGPHGEAFGQADVVRAVLAGRDVLAVIPTGGGKSLLYQVPALVLAERQDRPLSIVITPLQALMFDQVAGLQRRGLRGAAARTGADSPEVRQQTMRSITSGETWLLYLAPEQLDNPRVREALSGRALGLIAIDEAHCVAEWGHDFRLAYARLAAHLRGPDGLLTGRDVPILALTATARTAPLGEGDTVDEVHTMLGLRPDAQVLVADTTRTELTWEARSLPDIDANSPPTATLPVRLPPPWERGGDWVVRAPAIAAAIREAAPAAKTIVYVLWARDAALLARWLREALQRPTLWYTGQDTAAHRASALAAFQQPREGPDAPILVATTAFGMGVDVPDVSLVVHANAPSSPEAWSQEVGRGARGPGRRARGIAVWHPQDLVRQASMVRRGRIDRATLATLLAYVRTCVVAAWPTRTVVVPVAALCRVAGWEDDAGDRVTYAVSLLCLVRCHRGRRLLERAVVETAPDAPITLQWLGRTPTTRANLAPALAHDARRTWGQACRQRRVREALTQPEQTRQAWVADWFAGRVPFRVAPANRRRALRWPRRRVSNRHPATWTGVAAGPTHRARIAAALNRWRRVPLRAAVDQGGGPTPMAVDVLLLAVRDASLEAAATAVLDVSGEAIVAPWGTTTRVLARRILRAAGHPLATVASQEDAPAAAVATTRELLRAAAGCARGTPSLPLVACLRTSGVRVWVPDAHQWDEDHVGLLRAIWGQEGWDAIAVLPRPDWSRGVPGRLGRVWELAGAVPTGAQGPGVAWRVEQGPRYAPLDRADVLAGCGVEVKRHPDALPCGDTVCWGQNRLQTTSDHDLVAALFAEDGRGLPAPAPLGLLLPDQVDADRWCAALRSRGWSWWHADTWNARRWAVQVFQQAPSLCLQTVTARLCLAAPGPMAPDALALLAAYCLEQPYARLPAVVWRSAAEAVPAGGLPASVHRWVVCWPSQPSHVHPSLVDALVILEHPIVWWLPRRRGGWRLWS